MQKAIPISTFINNPSSVTFKVIVDNTFSDDFEGIGYRFGSMTAQNHAYDYDSGIVVPLKANGTAYEEYDPVYIEVYGRSAELWYAIIFEQPVIEEPAVEEPAP